ncbi:dihydrofolate reductase [Parapedobacter pyrenivorans]|uniref:Dihydrofolate reductase n=1 Tax=Parapedobacter pyrenivorans TaxID=1305674 RepID=A0A917HK21_9SPHI|nr:dihydrofolate reductase [Parapedobacter pyrenivorans]GGG81882.1 dihydrofolate reductase [Parapedobacter pyrenivorans]
MKRVSTKFSLLLASSLAVTTFHSCRSPENNANDTDQSSSQVKVDAFADLEILRYEVPGFDALNLQQKKLAYYLYKAALSGRDIIYDQRGKNNLTIRKTLEAIFNNPKTEKNDGEWAKFKEYAGRFWFSNGAHHHYSNDKFVPECSQTYFAGLVKACDPANLPLLDEETTQAFVGRITPILFNPKLDSKMVNLADGIDHVALSSNNFYEGVTQQEVEDFYAGFPHTGQDPEWGLNSKVIKVDGKLTEKVWKSGGMYGDAIDQMIFWLEKAIPLAENPQQKQALTLLSQYYQTGDLKIWDEYNKAWVQDTTGTIDFANGFIEVYNDAMGIKGSYEAVLSLKDLESTKRIKAIADEAQWFEDHSPLMPAHKKKEVKGISAKAITVVAEAGDAAPSTPIGINLPNSDWLRRDYGSKSVSLSNIVHAYNESSANSGFLEEFVGDTARLNRMKKYGNLASDLHTDMHECIGHASGQINPGVGTTDKTLKSYASCLEEARADLVALYYILDPKLVEIGVMPSTEVGKAEYDSYMMNGLMTQLTRIKPGDQIEEAHMRNRALNAYWVYEKGKADNVVSFEKNEGKTFVQINDYEKLRSLFGELLREIQRIKSEGDYKAGKNLVETYGVKVNPELHEEVLARFATLNLKPYKGFIQPRLVAVEENGEITDVKLEYPSDFYGQMLEYGKDYALLPAVN